MGDNISDGAEAVAELVGIVIAATVGLGLLGAVSAVIREGGKTKRVRVNPNRVCDSCGDSYTLTEGRYLDFCDDECAERGALIKCGGCSKEFYRSEGYDGKYCQDSCYWEWN